MRCCSWSGRRTSSKKLAKCKRRKSDVKDGRVVYGEAKNNTNKEELVRCFKAIWVEVAEVGVFIIGEHACPCQFLLSCIKLGQHTMFWIEDVSNQ